MGKNSQDDVIDLYDEPISLLERRKSVRKYSYAAILYHDIRCGFIHTYSPTDLARIDDPLRGILEPERAAITYVNRLATTGMRQIHFPLEWIAGVTKNIAIGLDSECKQHGKVFGQNLDLAVPCAWWIDGAGDSTCS